MRQFVRSFLRIVRPCVVLILLTVVISTLTACSSPSEKLLEQFTEYRVEHGLDLYRQTIPQDGESSLVAVYETVDDLFGIMEFDGKENNYQEVEKKREVTTAVLSGDGKTILAILHPDQKMGKVKVNAGGQLEEFALDTQEPITMHTLNDSYDDVKIEVFDEQGNLIE
ncbi:hypothetical protein ANABIO32_29760 [Rossellomorea marisflavi]|uniref:hypothetical protein n=1 Tax=Rossellomorea marisflavi TaxID=189381 RepID=UPI0025C9AD2C|nr:hypothetical protein [Rossellomorea marisflavi]GLI85251.1 hypothetical protein ANABIO32_29760 [Rossellomorea marisflavi]